MTKGLVSICFRRILCFLLSVIIVAGCLPVFVDTRINASALITLSGVAHVQDAGDSEGIWDESTGILTLGTRGQSRRVEAITINLGNDTGLSGTLEYRVHIQDIGWQDYKSAGQTAGTSGQSKRLEGIEMYLTGDLATVYSVEYCVHIQDYGDAQGWVYDGALAGTTGESKRLEEVKVRLVEKNSGISTTVNYRVHRQDYGWESTWKTNGQISGTTGESKRLEGIEIHLSGNEYSGGVQYKTDIQNIGWESGWLSNGEMSGTQGQSLRLEAIQIELTGDIASYYDVYYRVHAQDYGWLGWAKNGEISGTSGLSKRLEAIQIVLVRKGEAAPGDVAGITSATNAVSVSADPSAQVTGNNGIVTGKFQMSGDSGYSLVNMSGDTITLGQKGSGKSLSSYILSFSNPSGKDISIAYRSHIKDYGWYEWSPSGQEITNTQKSGIETVQIILYGKDAFMYDVSYRVSIAGKGWQSWVSNGTMAGVPGQGQTIEAVEIKFEQHDSYDTPAWTLTEFADDSGNQGMFYTLRNNNDGTLVVIDGGYDANTAQVRSVIKLFGGKVDYWFLTHFDDDHASVFNNVYADPQGITIGSVYCTPLDYDYYLQCAADRYWDVPWVYKTFLDQTAGDSRIHYLSRGDKFAIDGLTIEVFNAYDQIVVNTGTKDVANYASLVFKISGEKDSFLVCGDVHSSMWTKLVSMYGSKLSAEYVQFGHHGNNHVSPDKWAVVNAKVGFFDGPAWLTQSDSYSAKALISWCQNNGIATYEFATAPNSFGFE